MSNISTMQGMTHDLAVREIMEYIHEQQDCLSFIIEPQVELLENGMYGTVGFDSAIVLHHEISGGEKILSNQNKDPIIATIDLALQLRKYKE